VLALTFALLGGLYVLRPPVDGRQVLAFAPWMVAGGAFHALHQVGVVRNVVAPFLAAPAVYVTTFVLAGFVWLVSALRAEMTNTPSRVARDLAVLGSLLLAVLTGFAYVYAFQGTEETLPLVWPAVGFLGAAVIAAPVYYLLTVWKTAAVGYAGLGGPLVVYAHALDGFTTAIGVDVIGTGERSPLPRYIMEFAEGLPTYEYIGKGWLFIVVKLVLATGLVVLLADVVEEEPTEGNLVLAFVAAVGMGPAANNVFLFLLSGV
jgi:uncharacterized membrane protein